MPTRELLGRATVRRRSASVTSSSSGTRGPAPATGLGSVRRPLLDGQPVLAHQRRLVELGAEHGLGELPQLRAALGPAAERRRGGDGRDRPERPLVGGDAERHTEPPQQHRDVGALRAVVGVELVEHEVAQRLAGAGEQRGVLAAQQQHVEHLVVGEQDVRRAPRACACLSSIDRGLGHRHAPLPESPV